MRILFYSYAYPNPHEPGLSTFNRTMIAGLAKDHEVRVVSPVSYITAAKGWLRGRALNGQFEAVPGVPAEYVPWYYTPKLFRHRYGEFMDRTAGRALKRAIADFQPDLVLSYWTHPDGEVAVKAAHQAGIRAAAMVGGSDVLINARQGKRRESILNVLQAADGVITVSDDIREVLVNDGISAEKLFVARRGVDRRVFHEGCQSVARRELGLDDQRPVLVSVGRLVDVKGHRYLIEACQRLSQRGVPVQCYFLGDGPLRGTLERHIHQLGLSNTVYLRGAQSSQDLARWYRASDLSVLASLSEGVPNVLMESIACGTPFVASNVGGIPEIADSRYDSLVPAGDSTALADAIAAQLAKPGSESRVPRRFEPSTMSEAANQLGMILRAIHQGRRTLSSDVAVMHETMTRSDLDADLVRESPLGLEPARKVPESFPPATEKTSQSNPFPTVAASTGCIANALQAAYGREFPGGRSQAQEARGESFQSARPQDRPEKGTFQPTECRSRT